MQKAHIVVRVLSHATSCSPLSAERAQVRLFRPRGLFGGQLGLNSKPFSDIPPHPTTSNYIDALMIQKGSNKVASVTLSTQWSSEELSLVARGLKFFWITYDYHLNENRWRASSRIKVVFVIEIFVWNRQVVVYKHYMGQSHLKTHISKALPPPFISTVLCVCNSRKL